MSSEVSGNSPKLAMQQSSRGRYYRNDILVAKPIVTDYAVQASQPLSFQFKRVVAINKMTIKGLGAGDTVSSVNIFSDKAFVGDYDLTQDEWSTDGKHIQLTPYADDSYPTSPLVADENGNAVVYFTCAPVENAMLTVIVKVGTGNNYSKNFSKTITFNEGIVKTFGVTVEPDVPNITLVENFSSSNAGSDNYNCASALSTEANREDFNYSWTPDGSGTVFKNGIKLGSGSATGSVSCSDMLQDISAGVDFTVKVYCAAWNIDDGKVKVTYNDESTTLDPANDAITVTTAQYSANDFVSSTDFTFKKVEGVDGFKIESTYRRILIDKVEIAYSTAIKTDLASPANLSVTGKTVTWDAVTGAASYNVTVGTNAVQSVNTNSYTFDGPDGYYDVSVVAVPSNTGFYNNSPAATLDNAKFGSPKLDTPTLASGYVDESSLVVSWTNDARATNGYTCTIAPKGGSIISEQINSDVTMGFVSFFDLSAETTYVITVTANAVTEGNAYLASTSASIEITTAAHSPWILEKIDVTSLPTKIEYEEGEPLDLDGVVVKATYYHEDDSSNEKVVDVTDQCTFTPSNGTILTETVLTVVYFEGKGNNFWIFVKSNPFITVLSEEFDNTSTSDSSSAITESTFANFSGSTAKAYKSKYGGLKLGASSAVGYITSKPLDLSKPFRVTLNVLKYGSDTGKVKVTVGEIEKEITPTDTDTSYTLDFDAASTNSTIRIGTTAKRAYIDNVIVEVSK